VVLGNFRTSANEIKKPHPEVSRKPLIDDFHRGHAPPYDSLLTRYVVGPNLTAVEVDKRWVNVLTQEIQAAPITLVAELARADTTVEQLMAMKAGDFIELERQSKIQVTIDGVPVFECQYGTHNAKYAIRIDKRLRGNDLGWKG